MGWRIVGGCRCQNQCTLFIEVMERCFKPLLLLCTSRHQRNQKHHILFAFTCSYWPAGTCDTVHKVSISQEKGSSTPHTCTPTVLYTCNSQQLHLFTLLSHPHHTSICHLSTTLSPSLPPPYAKKLHLGLVSHSMLPCI